MKLALAKSSSGDSELNSMNEAEELYNRSHQEEERQDSSEGSQWKFKFIIYRVYHFDSSNY